MSQYVHELALVRCVCRHHVDDHFDSGCAYTTCKCPLDRLTAALRGGSVVLKADAQVKVHEAFRSAARSVKALPTTRVKAWLNAWEAVSRDEVLEILQNAILVGTEDSSE